MVGARARLAHARHLEVSKALVGLVFVTIMPVGVHHGVQLCRQGEFERMGWDRTATQNNGATINTQRKAVRQTNKMNSQPDG